MNNFSIFYNTGRYWRATALAIFAFIFYSAFLPCAAAAGASLYLFPPSGTYQVGQTFAVSVRLASGETAVNAAEAALVFNPAELQVVAISKTGSVFDLWTSDPVFSNAAGTINFGGGTKKGLTGSAGTILAVNFKAKANASAQVNFSSGSILAADGKGTNVLAGMNGGHYTLSPVITIPAPEKVSSQSEQNVTAGVGVPLAPIVSSGTHPDPAKWYANNDPQFSWELPEGITQIRMAFDQNPASPPVTVLSPSTAEKNLADLKDGAWYLHIQFQNNIGWGAILHRKFLIDTQPPSTPEIKVDNQGGPTNPSPTLIFSANDSLSGVQRYEIRIGEGDSVGIAPTHKTGPESYQPPAQAPGKHVVILKAIDAAGNFSMAAAELAVDPLETPLITDCPKEAREGDILIVKGAARYPGAAVIVTIKRDGGETQTQKTFVDADGKWVFVYDKGLQKGAYQVWARIADARGAQSLDSSPAALAVQPTAFVRVGTVIIDYFGAIMLLLGLILIFGALVFLIFFAIARLRRRQRSKTAEFSDSVNSSFYALREELRKQVEYLDNQPGLSESEKTIYVKLTDALAALEKFINSQIDNLKKG